MRRLASALIAVSMAGGCVSNSPTNSDVSGHVSTWDRRKIREVPGVVGAYGERVPMSASAMNVPKGGVPLITGPNGELRFADGKPLPKSAPTMTAATTAPAKSSDIVQASHYQPGPGPMGHGAGVQQAVNFGPLTPGLPHHHHGAPPGMGGPDPGAMANALPRFPAQRTQVRFGRPSGMKVAWFTQTAEGRGAFSQVPTDTPGRYNFPQGAIYRLKLSNIDGRAGLEVYPTIEVFPTTPKSESFLAHSSVPVDFTPDDFKQIAEGSYVVKVIYLPDPAFQDVASTGTEEILSTRLEPGVDPIQEAIRRGTILLVVRMGNIDQEAPNTPPLNTAAPGGAGPNPIMNFGPTTSGQTPNSMVPFGPTGGGGPGGLVPPGMMSAPPTLPPMISSVPPTMNGPVTGIPVNRPGTATATSPTAIIPPSTLPGPALR